MEVRELYRVQMWEIQNGSVLDHLSTRLQHALRRGYRQCHFDKNLGEMDIWDLYKLYQRVSGIGEKSFLQLHQALNIETPTQEESIEMSDKYMWELYEGMD